MTVATIPGPKVMVSTMLLLGFIVTGGSASICAAGVDTGGGWVLKGLVFIDKWSSRPFHSTPSSGVDLVELVGGDNEVSVGVKMFA